MKQDLEERACELAVYVIETGATVRAAAKHFGISKSTVHKALTQRLRLCNYPLYVQVRRVLDKNKRSGISGAAWRPGGSIGKRSEECSVEFGVKRSEIVRSTRKKDTQTDVLLFLVGEAGLEPARPQ